MSLFSILPTDPRQRTFLTVAAGVFMSTLDGSMINVALPTLMRDLHAPLALTAWVVQIYLLTISVLLLFWGHFAAVRDGKTIYHRGMLCFTAGSLFCALAPTMHWLIACRFLQGLGASMMMAIGPALIKSIFPANQLGRGLGMIGIATSLGLLSGPVISGFLIHHYHWRMIFLATVPFSLFFYFFDPPKKQEERAKNLQSGLRFSFRSLLLWSLAVSCTVLFANYATVACCSAVHWQTLTLSLGALFTAGSWLLLLLHERSAIHPFVPLHLFSSRFFSMALLSALLSFTVLFFVLLLFPFYLERVRALSPDRVGLVMMAVPATVFLISPLAGRLFDTVGARPLATSGMLLCACSTVLLSMVEQDTSLLQISSFLTLLGAGQALFLAPNSASALKQVNGKDVGITASLLATSRNLGMLLGTTLASFLFALSFAGLSGGLDLRDYTANHSAAFMTSQRLVLLVGTGLALLGGVTSWIRGRGSNEKTEN